MIDGPNLKGFPLLHFRNYNGDSAEIPCQKGDFLYERSRNIDGKSNVPPRDGK